MVTVIKNDNIRICLDPTNLNKAIKRAHYPLPTIEETVQSMGKARIFSTFDAKDGFWQIELTEKSSYLTTFNTPFGRYRWLRMPFGIKSASEEFQRRMNDALEGLEGVKVIIDDILVIGCGDTDDEAIKDHDKKLIALMERIKEKNIRLNPNKIKFKQKSVKYIGHVLSSEGLNPDQDKVQAILSMPTPENVSGVETLLGMVGYLSKFLPQLSTVTQPLRILEKKDIAWHWGPKQEECLK